MVGDHGDIMYCHIESVDQGGTTNLTESMASLQPSIKPAQVVLVPSKITVQGRPNGRLPFLTVVKDPKCTADTADSQTTKPSATAATNTQTTSSPVVAEPAGQSLKQENGHATSSAKDTTKP